MSSNFTPTNPVTLTADLVRCPSVTPKEGGALVLLENCLTASGFSCSRIDRNGVPNLFAKFEGPSDRPAFGFNGHTDVVPTGDESEWSVPPFSGKINDGYLWGRGATDMKSGVAAFVAASIDFVRQSPEAGSVIITVTGDEEANAKDGTIAILDWMREHGETMEACLVGEPTCRSQIGDRIKIGRRGSLNARFKALGKQGHSAYPERSHNAVQAIASLAHRLHHSVLDHGSENFAPSTLAVTNIDTGNTASNVIPGRSEASVNIRFNDNLDSKGIIAWLKKHADEVEKEFNLSIEINVTVTGECFLTPPGNLSDLVAKVVRAKTGQNPELSTSGGTSDARFIKDMCPVVEFGLVGDNMHQTDERVRIDDIHLLKQVYLQILRGFFA